MRLVSPHWLLLPLFGLEIPAFADDLQYLDHSELALARLYHDISGAQSTIDLTYLTWDPCSSAAKVLMKKIREKTHAQPKPVKVRMLLDSYFQKDKLNSLTTYFAENGVELKIYNPDNRSADGDFPHSHAKLCLVDKNVPGHASLISGGRNIGDEYFGLSDRNFVDRDVAVNAHSAVENGYGTIAQAMKGYDRLWEHYFSQTVRPLTSRQKSSFQSCIGWTERDERLEKYLQANAQKILEQEKSVSCGRVRFAIDDMSHISVNVTQDLYMGKVGDPYLNDEKIRKKPATAAVLKLLEGTESTLTMENQFYIPNHQIADVLNDKKLHHGVKIDLYSNMFEDSQQPVTYWHTRHMRSDNGNGQRNHSNFAVKGLLDRWDLTPPGALYTYHAKTFVADHANAIVGSFNIDPRSLHTNGESVVVVNGCPAFAQKVEQTAKLTGQVWTGEENLAVCRGQKRPQPIGDGGFNRILQFFTREYQ